MNTDTTPPRTLKDRIEAFEVADTHDPVQVIRMWMMMFVRQVEAAGGQPPILDDPPIAYCAWCFVVPSWHIPCHLVYTIEEY
jgi:hypothetical protein